MGNVLDKSGVKICMLTSAHPPFDPRIFHKEAQTLVKAGYDLVLIAQHSKEETVDGVRIVPLSKPRNRFVRRTRVVWKLLKLALKEKADVYHFHDPEVIPAGLILKLFGNKVVYDVHEYYSEVISARVGIKLGRNFIRFIASFFLERIPSFILDLLVFPTHSLEKEYGASSRSLTLLNFPTIESVRECEDNSDRGPKRFDIVHLGTITPPRMSFMLNVATELSKKQKDFKWLFVGMPRNTIEWSKRNYSEVFLKRYIVMVERVPYSEALRYLEDSRIGFNYHPYEKRFLVAIPMKVFEYMTKALPVVTTTLPELRGYMKNGVNALLIDSQDPVKYSEAIKSLLDDHIKASEMGFRGKRLVMEELNWERSEAGKLLRAYEDLIERGFRKWPKE